MQVNPGYLSVVQKRAKDYCEFKGAMLAPFGVNTPEAIEEIARAAVATGETPDEVWCAAGSGVLSRGLKAAWPNAKIKAVQVGRELTGKDVGNAEIFIHGLSFGQECAFQYPFPSDPHYDAKAWELAMANKGNGNVLFWNVTGPAEPTY